MTLCNIKLFYTALIYMAVSRSLSRHLTTIVKRKSIYLPFFTLLLFFSIFFLLLSAHANLFFILAILVFDLVILPLICLVIHPVIHLVMHLPIHMVICPVFHPILVWLTVHFSIHFNTLFSI